VAADVHSESETVEPVDAETTESPAGADDPAQASDEAVEPAGENVVDAAGGDEDEADGLPKPRKRRMPVLLGVAAFALLLDAVSKALVVSRLSNHDPVRLPGGFLYLTLVRNPGAAWSIGDGQTWVFTIIATTVAVVILRIARNLRSLPWACALGLLLGGALGNLGDRIFRAPAVFRGHVVDFLQFPTFPIAHYNFPVFNLADSAICVGGALMVVLSFRGIQPDGTRHVSPAKADASPADEERG
jgi:signal peptidase II